MSQLADPRVVYGRTQLPNRTGSRVAIGTGGGVEVEKQSLDEAIRQTTVSQSGRPRHDKGGHPPHSLSLITSRPSLAAPAAPNPPGPPPRVPRRRFGRP